MAFRNKEEFFRAVPPAPFVEVPIGGGESIRLKALNVAEMIRHEEAAKGKSALEGVTLLVIASAVNEDGEPLFDEADGPRLQAALTSDAFREVFDAAAKINGLGPDDVDQLEKK